MLAPLYGQGFLKAPSTSCPSQGFLKIGRGHRQRETAVILPAPLIRIPLSCHHIQGVSCKREHQIHHPVSDHFEHARVAEAIRRAPWQHYPLNVVS